MDIECPYCEKELDINHDDGFGYEEGVTHQMECKHCDKSFVFTTSISFYYDPEKADCLNGGEHNYELTHTFPKPWSKMRCSMCDKKRDLTIEERKSFGIGTKESYFNKLIMKKGSPDKETKKEIGRMGTVLNAIYPKRSRIIITKANDPIGIKHGNRVIVEFAQSSSDDITTKYWYKTDDGVVTECEDIQYFWDSWQQNEAGSSCRKDTEDYTVFAFHQYHISRANMLFRCVDSWGESLKENAKSLIDYAKMQNLKTHRLIISGTDNITELINELDISEIKIDESIPKEIFYIESK